MRKFAILASVIILAAGSSNCSSPAGAASEIVPSGLVAGSAEGAATFGTNAAGGQGKGKSNAPAIGSTSQIDVVMVVDNNTEGLSWGDVITFAASSSPTNGFMDVSCFQGSSWVYAVGGYQLGRDLTLASTVWTGGAASCTVRVYTTTDGIKTTTVGTLDFNVGE